MASTSKRDYVAAPVQPIRAHGILRSAIEGAESEEDQWIDGEAKARTPGASFPGPARETQPLGSTRTDRRQGCQGRTTQACQ